MHDAHARPRSFSRRTAFRLGGGALAATTLPSAQAATQVRAQATPAPPAAGPPAGGPVPTSGSAVPALAGFDTTMVAFMRKWQVPGGQLAVAKDGHLVLNRGYGVTDGAGRTPVQPDNLFRIASVSKTITTVAILALVDDGKLALTDKVFPLLGFSPPPHATVDPRLNQITIKDLLVHAGGWDSTKSFDPQYLPWSRMAAATLGQADPPEAATIVRFMLGQPLDFAPGTASVYSNFGFNVLGRVIEQVSGQSYANFTLARVLNRAGITGMRIGGTREIERAPGEVAYANPATYRSSPQSFGGRAMCRPPMVRTPCQRSMPTAAGSPPRPIWRASPPPSMGSMGPPCSPRRPSRR